MGKIRRTNRKRTYTKKRSRKVSRKTYKQKKPRTKRIKRGRKKMLRGGSAAPAGDSNRSFEFTVQNLRGDKVMFAAKPNSTIGEIKGKMEGRIREEINPLQLRAIWAGKELNNHETLSKVGITKGAELHLVSPKGVEEMKWTKPPTAGQYSSSKPFSPAGPGWQQALQGAVIPVAEPAE